ncbi:hypothetical protein GCM10008910_41510 [Faecalicatena orotica]|uniref:Sortase B cell surface sorting signal n=1 Tax=Faecalicatena orotica TaxID=1544 RepID=A0A2Y9CAM6_9FIRM|nr:hypothetical protein [Faecalicatena orotica]PWJ22858.1 hypothetical protein A8806_11633 [Faecalicatena orotica]SSA57993.1 hypothetical protein SAMN05216536_11633 [Faecalicatena orotica]
MRKRILGFILAMVMIAAIPIEAAAEVIPGSSDWQVSFDGNKLSSNFKSSDLDASVYQILPGDTALIQLSLVNKANKDTNWYMSNEIIKSLEDGSPANGGAYTYILNYNHPDGKTTTEIYNSDTVGGDDADGLHSATDSLDEYFYLDRLSPGETGSIELRVTLDGETQGNDYQNTLAQLQMTFAAEVVAGDTTVTRPGTNSTIIKTGDSSNMILYLSIAAFAAGLIILIIVLLKIKNRDKERAEYKKRRSR